MHEHWHRILAASVGPLSDMNPAFTFAQSAQTPEVAARYLNPGPLERPVKTTLVITEDCNLDCRLCYGRCKDPKPRPELSIEDWRRVADDLAASGVIWLYIEGGEPFLKPGFVDFLADNTHRMFTMVRTNGTLVDHELAGRLKDIDVGIVLVDLWGATAATHDALTRTEGSFDRSVNGIRQLVAAGIETQMLFILNRITSTSCRPTANSPVLSERRRSAFFAFIPLDT